MPGDIRTTTLKNVILLISSIVISLAITLCYTEKAFADEPLPAASAEAEAEDIQPEEDPPEVEYTEPEAEPPSEGSETEDTGQYAAVENDAVYIGEETCGDAVQEDSALVLDDEEKSDDTVPADSAVNAAEEVTSTDSELSSDSVSKTEVIKTNTKTGTKPSATQKVQTAVITVKPARTGDTSNVSLWLVLMFLASATLIVVYRKKAIRI